MRMLRYQQTAPRGISILTASCAVLVCALIFLKPANTQETMKPKGKIRCWVKCCPLEIGCEFDTGSSGARRNAPSADIVIKGDQLIAEFKPTNDQTSYEVKAEMNLDAKTAEALGFKEITLLPGKYPLTKIANGMAKVSIKVKTIAGGKPKNAT